jgi:hypothetical protein
MVIVAVACLPDRDQFIVGQHAIARRGLGRTVRAVNRVGTIAKQSLRDGPGEKRSTKPASFKPWRNAVTRCAASARDVSRRNPITGIDGCALLQRSWNEGQSPFLCVYDRPRRCLRLLRGHRPVALCFRLRPPGGFEYEPVDQAIGDGEGRTRIRAQRRAAVEAQPAS